MSAPATAQQRLGDGSPLPRGWSLLSERGEDRLWLVSCGRDVRLAVEGAPNLLTVVARFNPTHNVGGKPGPDAERAGGHKAILQAVNGRCPQARSITFLWLESSLPFLDSRPRPRPGEPPLPPMQRRLSPQGSDTVSIAEWRQYIDENSQADAVTAGTIADRMAAQPNGAALDVPTDPDAFNASFASAWGQFSDHRMTFLGKESVATARIYVQRYLARLAEIDRDFDSNPKLMPEALTALSNLMRYGIAMADTDLASRAATATATVLDRHYPNMFATRLRDRAHEFQARQLFCQLTAVGRLTNMFDAAQFRQLLEGFATSTDPQGFPCDDRAAFTLGQMALADGDVAAAARWFARCKSPVARFVEGTMIARGVLPGGRSAAFVKFRQAADSNYPAAVLNAAQMVLSGEIRDPAYGPERALSQLADVGQYRAREPAGKIAADMYRRYQADHDTTAWRFVAGLVALSSAVEKFCEGRNCGNPGYVDRMNDANRERLNESQRQQSQANVNAYYEYLGGNGGAMFMPR